jgi:hypothetical protein
MDLRSLKLELLERIALCEDEGRLLALKRLLDAPRGYGIPNEHLSVVHEDLGIFPELEDRSYSAEEVLTLLMEWSQKMEADLHELDQEERTFLEASRHQYLRGEGKWYSLNELKDRIRERKGR